ncbi:MAG: hypothetical protein HZC24_09630, partial [Rhodocyclales bacterium]|nr:hypothetical protein [Rhodocyclales bacterium]
TLDGGDGVDVLSGGSGDDTLFGGSAADQLAGGEGADILLGEAGNDTLAGDAGNDHLGGGPGDDTLTGGDGVDLLLGSAGNDTLSGDAGSDELQGGDGNDALTGGADADRLFGEAGHDTLTGGAGDDILVGGDGNDTYVYNLGDGIDRIVDSNANGQINTLVFGAGIDASQIKLGLGSLLLDLGNGNAVHIDNFNPDDPLGSTSIQRFEFADGTALSVQQVLARGFDLAGTDGNDVIHGTGTDDRITGGKGADSLQGGLGNDTYIYHRGDGADSIVDYWIWTAQSGEQFGNTNTLSLGAGISAADIAVRFDSGTRHVTLDFGGGDSIDIGLVDNIGVRVLQFADGSSQFISEFFVTTGGCPERHALQRPHRGHGEQRRSCRKRR